MRADTKRQAADRALRTRQQQQANTAGITAGQVTASEAAVLAGPSPDTGQPYTEEEWDLRERLRLEAVERRSRSLRSSPIAQTYRKLDRGGGSAAERIDNDPLATAKAEGAAALQTALDTIGTVTGGLEEQIAGGGTGRSRLYRRASGNTRRAGSGPAYSRRDFGQRHRARLLFSGAGRDSERPARLGAYL